jgi:hypothetical protein
MRQADNVEWLRGENLQGSMTYLKVLFQHSYRLMKTSHIANNVGQIQKWHFLNTNSVLPLSAPNHSVTRGMSFNKLIFKHKLLSDKE